VPSEVWFGLLVQMAPVVIPAIPIDLLAQTPYIVVKQQVPSTRVMLHAVRHVSSYVAPIGVVIVSATANRKSRQRCWRRSFADAIADLLLDNAMLDARGCRQLMPWAGTGQMAGPQGVGHSRHESGGDDGDADGLRDREQVQDQEPVRPGALLHSPFCMYAACDIIVIY
jgi:hypothetical protein